MRRSEEFAKRRLNISETIEKIFRYFPDGVEKLEHRTYRLCDYFDRIELHKDIPERPRSLALVFHTHQDADPYWKDLVVAAVRCISEATGAAIRSISQST